MTEKCVVTGGAGFIGSHVVDLLVQQGADVYIVDDLSTGRKENLNPKAKFCQGSICDLRFLQEVFKDATYVFHLAALPRIQPSFEDPVGHEEVNVLGTIRCLEALKAVKTLRKLVYSSSSACYGTPLDLPTSEKAAISPLSPYALQKYTAEQYCLILGERYQIP
jgi:UDP-glucose 4-epimerase